LKLPNGNQKDRQYNGKKGPNNDLQNITQKTKDRVTQIPHELKMPCYTILYTAEDNLYP
jgi:hypothetical protein